MNEYIESNLFSAIGTASLPLNALNGITLCDCDRLYVIVQVSSNRSIRSKKINDYLINRMNVKAVAGIILVFVGCCTNVVFMEYLVK